MCNNKQMIIKNTFRGQTVCVCVCGCVALHCVECVWGNICMCEPIPLRCVCVCLCDCLNLVTAVH